MLRIYLYARIYFDAKPSRELILWKNTSQEVLSSGFFSIFHRLKTM